MKPTLVAAVAAMSLAGCATTVSAPDQAAAPSGAMACKADAAQSHVGQEAGQVTGIAILKDSGARTLRWGSPNSAWTMDFREDRVNVRYDDTMKITDITCG